MRCLAWIGVSIGVLVGEALLLCGLVLLDGDGQRAALPWLLRLARPAIGVRVGEFSGNLWRGFSLRDVVIEDAEGRPAIAIARIDARLRPWPLWRRRVVVDAAAVDGLAVRVRQLADGRLNIATLALPCADRRGLGKCSGWTVIVKNAVIDAVVADDRPGPWPARARARLVLDDGRLDGGELALGKLSVRIVEPFVAGIFVAGSAGARGAFHDVRVAVSLDAADLRRYLPRPVALHGDVVAGLRLDGAGPARATLAVVLPRGVVAADGLVALDSTAWHAGLAVRGVDPAAAIAGIPHGNVELVAAARGQGRQAAVAVERLLVDAAGAKLAVRGRVDEAGHGELQFLADDEDLSQLAAIGAPRMTGAIHARGTVSRSATRWTGDVRLRATRLAALGLHLRRGELRANLRDFLGRLRAHTDGLRAGGRTVERFDLDAAATRDRLALSASGRGPRDFDYAFTVAGAPFPWHDSSPAPSLVARLLSLRISAHGVIWRSLTPARLGLVPAARLLSVDNLRLASGVQLVIVSGTLAPERLAIALAARRIDLASLGRLLGMPGLPRSRFDSRAEIAGTPTHPHAHFDAQITLGERIGRGLPLAIGGPRGSLHLVAALGGTPPLRVGAELPSRDLRATATWDGAAAHGAVELKLGPRRVAADLDVEVDQIHASRRFSLSSARPD